MILIVQVRGFQFLWLISLLRCSGHLLSTIHCTASRSEGRTDERTSQCASQRSVIEATMIDDDALYKDRR